MENPSDQTSSERRDAWWEALGWATLLVFVCGLGIGGSLLAMQAFLHANGIAANEPLRGWDAVGFGPGALFAFAIFGYLGGAAWLVFSRLFLRKNQVLKIVTYGLYTRLELWLVDKLFSKRSS